MSSIVPSTPSHSSSQQLHSAPMQLLSPSSPMLLASESSAASQQTPLATPPFSPAQASSSTSLTSPLPISSPLSPGGGKFLQSSLPPFLESPLWKKGSTFGGWTKRYYYFHPELSRIFYSKEEKGPIRGEIIVTRFTVRAIDNGGLTGQFLIDSPNRAHILRADDSHTAQQWIDALTDLQHANESRKESMVEATKTANVALQAQRCAGCQATFGLLRRPIICRTCGLAFCGSLKCMEPKSVRNSNQDRCCISCADARDSNGAVTASGGNAGDAKKSGPLGLGQLFTVTTKTKPSNSNLLIRVISGKQLMACDAGGTSDPYVCIFFEGQEYKTEVQWKTLNPIWNQQFNIPIHGQSRDIQIGVYDSDRYSNDDFMGFVHIPLSDLETDRVYEDFFPLKPRPGKKADKELPISGVLHLQIIKSESLFALFAPIWENSLQPEEKYSQAVLKHNVKRIQAIVESLNLSWYQAKIEDIFNYTHPLQSILFLIVYWMLVLFYPSEWILPTIPVLLLMKMGSNFIADQGRIILQLEEAANFQQKIGLWNGTADSLSDLGAGAAEGGEGAGGEDEDEYEEEEEDDEEGGDERTMAIGFLGKIKAYQKQLAKIQSVIGKVCDKLEAVQNLFRWYDKRKSKFVGVALVGAFVFLLIVPFRVLLLLGGTAKWAKKLIGIVKKKLPKGKKPSEVENFLERAPTSVSLNPSKIHLVKKLKHS